MSMTFRRGEDERWRGPGNSVFEPFLDGKGQEVRLGSYWNDRPAVLVLCRHFGCIFARRYAQELRARHTSFKELGAEIVLVGCGKPAQALQFQEDLLLPFDVLTDPSRKVYEISECKRSVAGVWNRQSWTYRHRARKEGVRQAGLQGDQWQLGATMVVTPDDRVIYRHTNEVAGDDPDVNRVLGAVISYRQGIL